MRIQVLSRGGLSVYGGDYDAKRNAALLRLRPDETEAVLIEYASTPSSVTVANSGLSATTPTVSGSQLTTTISGQRGYVEIAATVGGQVRKVRIETGQVGYDAYASPVDSVDLSAEMEGLLDF